MAFLAGCSTSEVTCPMWKLRAPSKARKKQLPKSEREGCRKSFASPDGGARSRISTARCSARRPAPSTGVQPDRTAPIILIESLRTEQGEGRRGLPPEENPTSESEGASLRHRHPIPQAAPGPGTWCFHGESSSPILPSTFWVPVSQLLDSYIGCAVYNSSHVAKGDFISCGGAEPKACGVNNYTNL